MKVATWNVNGIRARSSQLLHWIDGEEPDVICLQEIKASPEQVPEPVANVAGYHAHFHGAGGYSGVALLLRQKTFGDTPVFSHPSFDLENRIVVAEVGSMVLASVYVPNGGKDLAAKMLFLRELEQWAGALEAAGKHLVLCGDYNVARTFADVHPILRKPMVGQSPEERALIEKLLGHSLVDVGRHVEPENDRLFTWWAPWRNMREKNIGWRLDFVVADAGLAERAVACDVQKSFGTSDHAPVIARFED